MFIELQILFLSANYKSIGNKFQHFLIWI